MKSGQAPIVKVMEVVSQREQLLSDIKTAANKASVDEIEKMLIRLRGLSIKTVEMIVLWRD